MATTRTATTTWHGTLFEGSGRVELSRPASAASTSPGRRAPRSPRQDEPRGADRGGALVVLLDGAVERARQGGQRRPRRSRRRPTSRSSPARASPASTSPCGARCPACRRTTSSPPPRPPRRAARSARRSPAPRSPSPPALTLTLIAVALRSRWRGEDGVEDGVGAVERRAVDALLGGVGEGGVAGAEVAGGHAERREAGHVGPAELGGDREVVPVDERPQDRVVEPGRGRRRAVDDGDARRRPRGPARAAPAPRRPPRPRCDRGRSAG